MFGCGYDDRFRGKALCAYEFGAPELATCPHYYARQPLIGSLSEQIEDYRRGALGPIWSLPAPMVDGLRVLDAEMAAWKSKQDEEVSNGS